MILTKTEWHCGSYMGDGKHHPHIDVAVIAAGMDEDVKMSCMTQISSPATPIIDDNSHHSNKN